MNWEDINQQITLATGRPFSAQQVSAQGGGCINQAYRISNGEQHFFVKLNEASLADMFEAEYEGLEALRKPDAISVPRPICTGIQDHQSYIVLEAMDLRGSCDPALLGTQLARLHMTHADHFGWHRDNTIGSTPQQNQWTRTWIDFYRAHRLEFQLQLAREHGIGATSFDRGMRLSSSLECFFGDYQPRASLLHGDLWSGNVAADASGNPVIFDPAVYYGDAETDLAMTELFGGFGSRFFDAYDTVRPIDPGYKTRRTLYNLYHILNHYNLFGGGYGSQAASMIDRLLAEI